MTCGAGRGVNREEPTETDESSENNRDHHEMMHGVKGATMSLLTFFYSTIHHTMRRTAACVLA